MCCKVSAAEYEVGIVGLFMNRCGHFLQKNLIII